MDKCQRRNQCFLKLTYVLGFFVFGFVTLLSKSLLANGVNFLSSKHSLAAGYSHTCAIKNEKLYCWGGNLYGQLGIGNTSDAASAKLVKNLPGRVSQVSTFENHTCAVTTEGLFCWGKNSFGALGTGDRVSHLLPVQVQGLPEGKEVSSVSTGDHHTCAVVDGGLMCWGWNRSCTLGKPHCVGGNANNGDFEVLPKWVTSLGPSSGVTEVVAGETHTCAIVKNGLRCWGWNLYGKLGFGYKDQEYTATPRAVKGLGEDQKVTDLSVSNHVSCAQNFNRVRCWGRNPLVGRGIVDNGHTPTLIAKLTHQDRPSQLNSNGTNTCLINFGRQIICFGFNSFGQLAHPDFWSRDYFPMAIEGLPTNTEWQSVQNGNSHVCAQEANGDIWCWGWNAYCQMGNGECSGSVQDIQYKPSRVVGLDHF